MATVFIPTQLTSLTDGSDRIELDAKTVREVVDQLDSRFPGIKGRLCDGEQLAPGLQVSIDHVMTSQGLSAKVKPDSEVHFLPALGGG